MPFTYVNAASSDNTEALVNSGTLSVGSVLANDLIAFCIRYRNPPSAVVSSVTINSQAFTQIGSLIDDGEALTGYFWIKVSAGTSATINWLLNDFSIVNTAAVVLRPASTTAVYVDLSTQTYNSGTYTDPSRSLSSNTTDQAIVSFLTSMGWDTGFGSVNPVYTPSAPFTQRTFINNAGQRAVWDIRAATEIGNTGTVTATWTKDAGTPMYVHTILRFSSTPVVAISDINGNEVVRVGSSGNTYTSDGLGALTSLTIGSVAATSLVASVGSGTFSFPPFVDGNVYQLLGTKTATGNDGTLNGTISVSLQPPLNYSYVTLSGTLNNSTTGILNNFSPAAVVTDQIVYPSLNTVDAQGNIETDVVGTQTFYHIQASTGIVRSYSVITGLPKVEDVPNQSISKSILKPIIKSITKSIASPIATSTQRK